jgi:hypothetical protein
MFRIPYLAEERTDRNSVLWNKNRSKRSKFCFGEFCGKENSLKFRSVGQKRGKLSEFFPEHFAEEKIL